LVWVGPELVVCGCAPVGTAGTLLLVAETGLGTVVLSFMIGSVAFVDGEL
jgi:hypothetical protein